MRGSALLEFAIAWPVALLLITGGVQYTIWGTEVQAAQRAAVAGARAGSRSDAPPSTATQVAIATLGPTLIGVRAAPWCPGEAGPGPELWVCSTSFSAGLEVRVKGSVPALLPLLPGTRRLPVDSDVRMDREAFR